MKKIISLLAILLILPTLAFAQTDIYIRGSGKLFPVAVPQLCAASGENPATRDIPRILARDLDLSGYFQVLNSESYVETPGKCAGPDGFAYSDWTVIGAEGLVRGTVYNQGAGVKVQLYLHDVQRQKVVLGKEYEGDVSQIPLMAHKFANEVMKFFTGEAGIFGTQIAFTSKVGRFKELFLMDMDGSNIRQLTNDHSLSTSASWAPDMHSLIYTSYRLRTPDLFLLDVATKRISQVTKNNALEIGAKLTRDGRHIVTAVTQDRGSNLVMMNLQGQIEQRLTPANSSIDVSPEFSPDQSKIAFCSDRAGGPQIYVMSADGGSPHRISFVSSSYCTSPDWSPKGDRIAFVCRAEGKFQIFVTSADGSNPQQLTSNGTNEDPDWSPDGRYLAFATTFGKGSATSLALMRDDGSSVHQLTQSRIGDSEPAWSTLVP